MSPDVMRVLTELAAYDGWGDRADAPLCVFCHETWDQTLYSGPVLHADDCIVTAARLLIASDAPDADLHRPPPLIDVLRQKDGRPLRLEGWQRAWIDAATGVEGVQGARVTDVLHDDMVIHEWVMPPPARTSDAMWARFDRLRRIHRDLSAEQQRGFERSITFLLRPSTWRRIRLLERLGDRIDAVMVAAIEQESQEAAEHGHPC